MLKKRIITALILIPLFVALVLLLSPIAFAALTAIFVIWGAWEWSLLMGVVRFPHCFFYPLAMLFILWVSLILPLHTILYITVGFWVFAAWLTMIYPTGRTYWGKGVILRSLMGIMVLIPTWLAINWIHASQDGPVTLLFLLILIWGADSAAYFAGKKWGKHKLSRQVSPGKTWEGLMGALFTTVIIALGMAWMTHLPYAEWLWALLLSLVTIVFSIIGDLFESMLKRNAGLKDSGQWLPGHGGLLDRIDSLTAAAPIFAVGAFLLGNGLN